MNQHTSHAEILLRLKRASGHLTKVLAMLEAGDECERVAQQLQAVSNALITAKRMYVTDHIEHCLQVQEGMTPEEIAEQLKALKTMTKYL
ncbi:MAG: metal-sensing transcriptional repressor [Gammaproteobacteria bacterium]|nr:metal-sensing transcriptional repressor [Gammaproteobacteria bacterium]MCB1851755.1 metal-sensing transcriptional repressor [Gammaproteobacteria bacterium]MCP5416366.1 metal-sensing transcriptional repressor [Chromatiaceae bacterium]